MDILTKVNNSSVHFTKVNNSSVSHFTKLSSIQDSLSPKTKPMSIQESSKSLASRVKAAKKEWKDAQKEAILRPIRRSIPKNLDEKIVKRMRENGVGDVYICRYNGRKRKEVDRVIKELNTDEIKFVTGLCNVTWGEVLMASYPAIFAYSK